MPNAVVDAKTMAKLASFREALQKARYPVALAGAGLSAASGVPTFRGAGGLWRSHDAMSLATPQAFRADPSKVWQFYHYRRELCLGVKPNAAHMALALLSNQDEVKSKVLPNAQRDFTLVTQNVDGLSVRAAHAVKGRQSPSVPIQIHGSLFQVRCTKCQEETSNFDTPIAAALQGTEDVCKEYGKISMEQLPRCQKANCGGLLRPAVVWFGESIPSIGMIEDLLDDCDLLLVIGTSSTVYPAAGFAAQVQAQGGRTAVFNLEEAGTQADWFFQGGVEDTLPWALGLEDEIELLEKSR